MSAFLFLQRFENGAAVAMPFAKVVTTLERHGKPGRGRGDLEVTFAEGTAASCTVVGDPQSGALCIGFERPHYDTALRRVVWDCMQALDCAVFNDTLDTICVLPGRRPLLPGAWESNLARHITTAEQLWPGALELSTESAPPVPAARYDNPNKNGPNLQFFDRIESPQQLTIDINMRPGACDPGTLRVLRNLELRVNLAVRTNPEYAAAYRFADPQTSLLFLESARLTQETMPATIVSPPPGTVVAPTGFVADRAAFATGLNGANKFVELVRQRSRVELDGSLQSIEALAKLLDGAHERNQQQRAASKSQTALDEATLSWALMAGAYLGMVVQRLIGGQWGYMTRPGSRRQPAIQMHNGHIRHPHLQVLDHITNGRWSDDVTAWIRALAVADRSSTSREEDIVCNVPNYCQRLLGDSNFTNGDELPLAAQLPRFALNFSIESLHLLDNYLRQVAAKGATLAPQSVSNLALLAGVYLGEVIRTNSADRGRWNWANYNDYVKANPGFSKQRPREFGFLAFLDSAANTTYPIAHVLGLLTGARLAPTHVYATQLCGRPGAPTPAGPSRAENGAMKQALEGARESLAKWRKIATETDLLALRAGPPSWMHAGHPLNEAVAQQSLLLQKGAVVWGALIQANNQLFAAGPDNHPGAVVYSADRYFDSRPEELHKMALELYKHKDKVATAPEPIRRLIEWLTDELEIASRVPVPFAPPEHPVLAASILFYRKHLPEKFLAGSWMPLLTHPQTRAIMVVPGRFWPRELLESWKSGKLDARR